MKFEIIGSGGCVALPKPLCNCRICKEAREKGKPYLRRGCALFLHDIELLIDTPEDITISLNESEIKSISNVMYSHLDPDHTLGFRVFEQLRLNWLEVFDAIECSNPINVYVMPHVMRDLQEIKSKYGSFFDYYETTRNLIKRYDIERDIEIDNVTITLLQIGYSTVFVFENDNRKVVYAPCDVKPFVKDDILQNADVLIVGDTFIGEILKDGYKLPINSKLRDELYSIDEVYEIKKKYNIKSLFITHIEEDWGKSYDDLIKIQGNYENLFFAYDGMIIEI